MGGALASLFVQAALPVVGGLIASSNPASARGVNTALNMFNMGQGLLDHHKFSKALEGVDLSQLSPDDITKIGATRAGSRMIPTLANLMADQQARANAPQDPTVSLEFARGATADLRPGEKMSFDLASGGQYWASGLKPEEPTPTPSADNPFAGVTPGARFQAFGNYLRDGHTPDQAAQLSGFILPSGIEPDERTLAGQEAAMRRAKLAADVAGGKKTEQEAQLEKLQAQKKSIENRLKVNEKRLKTKQLTELEVADLDTRTTALLDELQNVNDQLYELGMLDVERETREKGRGRRQDQPRQPQQGPSQPAGAGMVPADQVFGQFFGG